MVSAYIFIPYSFSPFSIRIALMASGIGRPPLIRTPSISNANANVSAEGVSAGVIGEAGVAGELEEVKRVSSSRFKLANSLLAVSIEAANVPP
jgi:hypothetical protein